VKNALPASSKRVLISNVQVSSPKARRHRSRDEAIPLDERPAGDGDEEGIHVVQQCGSPPVVGARTRGVSKISRVSARPRAVPATRHHTGVGGLLFLKRISVL